MLPFIVIESLTKHQYPNCNIVQLDQQKQMYDRLYCNIMIPTWADKLITTTKLIPEMFANWFHWVPLHLHIMITFSDISAIRNSAAVKTTNNFNIKRRITNNRNHKDRQTMQTAPRLAQYPPAVNSVANHSRCPLCPRCPSVLSNTRRPPPLANRLYAKSIDASL